MPLTASNVSPLVARSICPVGVTTYGFSPTCSTSASPSVVIMAWSSEGTTLIGLGGQDSCTRLHGVAGRHHGLAHAQCRLGGVSPLAITRASRIAGARRQSRKSVLARPVGGV